VFLGSIDYFSAIRSFAEPAVRFYTKFYLEPFSAEETTEYAEAAFRTHESCTVFYVGFTRKLWDIPISSHSSVESYWPALRVLYPKVLSTSGPMSFSSWKETNSD